MTNFQDQQLLSYLSNAQYLRVMREKVGPQTYEMLEEVRGNQDLPFGVRDLAAGLIEEYDSFDEKEGATLGHQLKGWHMAAWHLTSTVRLFGEDAALRARLDPSS